ncbi:integral membrane protein TerC family protein [Asticcacaulis biprosthecium C19]|uniref:Integral membrane protein TerC family protein n=1 Tax=Asticcacaulis biprosthecium C19 TaxID=715226 RepID=F4QGV7_9CAUL|nr:DUF475 domain-containing protein [Asticcacaulis biprosthecium]EGF93710.1 integral membrane protein TerC family protein [Asticcacaulis biprosthecium C19]
MLKNFYGSIAFTVVSLILAGVLGYYQSGGMASAVLQMVFLACVLGVMETSLSLDNAVVNASILKDMDPVWQRRFLTWGILIAVFGMRIIFPILIVSISAMVTPWEATRIAIMDHERYETIVTGAHIGISGFGGAFLMLVGLNFFFDDDREHHWLGFIERPLAALAKIPFSPYIVTALLIGGLSFMVHGEEQKTFLIAGLSGVVTFFAVQKFGDWVGGGEKDHTGAVVRTGAGGFIYLEFLDASFSFDGVIGAFAITNDIILIALGLGIGAMFVRSMTIALVRGGHLAEFRFLEAGAFYAIIALASIMLLSIKLHIPEVVTGLIGAIIIGVSLWVSIEHKKRFPQEYAEDGDAQIILPTGEVISDQTTQPANEKDRLDI